MQRVILVLVFSILALGCKPERPDVNEARAEEAAKRAETAKLAAEGDPAAMGKLKTETTADDGLRDQVLATIGESKITVGDVLAYIERQPREMQARYASHDQRKKLLQHLIDMELLAREGRARGLDSHPIVRQTLKQTLARQLLADLDAQSAGPGSIADDEVKAYYQANADAFVRHEKRRAAWIMLRTEEEAIKNRAEIMGIIAENPAMARQVFGDFAAKRSIDGETKVLKGDVGWFFVDGKNEEGQVRVDAAAAKAAFELEAVNSVTQPIALANETWALLQLTNEHPRVVRPFDEVTMDIRNRLLRTQQSERRRTFIEALKAKANIAIDEAAMKELAATKANIEAMPTLRLPSSEELRALGLGKGKAPVAKPAPDDPKLRLHPSATRHGLVHKIRGEPLRVVPKASRAEQATVEEVQEKMRRKKDEQ